MLQIPINIVVPIIIKIYSKFTALHKFRTYKNKYWDCKAGIKNPYVIINQYITFKVINISYLEHYSA